MAPSIVENLGQRLKVRIMFPSSERQTTFLLKYFQIPTEFLRFSLASLISELLKSTLANQKYSGKEHLSCAQYILNAMKLFFKLSLDSGLIK